MEEMNGSCLCRPTGVCFKHILQSLFISYCKRVCVCVCVCVCARACVCVCVHVCVHLPLTCIKEQCSHH